MQLTDVDKDCVQPASVCKDSPDYQSEEPQIEKIQIEKIHNEKRQIDNDSAPVVESHHGQEVRHIEDVDNQVHEENDRLAGQLPSFPLVSEVEEYWGGRGGCRDLR